MENVELRVLISGSGVKYKDLARVVGVSPEWLSKLMAKPLDKRNRLRILDALARIQTDKGGIRE